MGMRKTGYKHPMQFYATAYGIPVKTIQKARMRKWPLDDPKKLLKTFEDAPGPKTQLVLLRKIVNGDTAELQEPTPQSDDAGETVDEISQVSMALAGGLMEELARLKKETLASYRMYIAEQRPADRHLRNKIWLANVAALRQLAKEAPKAERDAKNVLVVADVESAWSRSFKEFKTSLESLGRRVSTLPLFAKLDPIDVEEVISKEAVVILSHLESGSWLKNRESASGD